VVVQTALVAVIRQSLKSTWSDCRWRLRPHFRAELLSADSAAGGGKM